MRRLSLKSTDFGVDPYFKMPVNFLKSVFSKIRIPQPLVLTRYFLSSLPLSFSNRFPSSLIPSFFLIPLSLTKSDNFTRSTEFDVERNYPPFSAVPRFRFTHNKKTDLKDRSFLNGAGYEVRTHNLDLGKVALCQLS